MRTERLNCGTSCFSRAPPQSSTPLFTSPNIHVLLQFYYFYWLLFLLFCPVVISLFLLQYLFRSIISFNFFFIVPKCKALCVALSILLPELSLKENRPTAATDLQYSGNGAQSFQLSVATPWYALSTMPTDFTSVHCNRQHYITLHYITLHLFSRHFHARLLEQRRNRLDTIYSRKASFCRQSRTPSVK